MTEKTRTFSFSICSKKALTVWTCLCTMEKNYEYLCMNIKKNTIKGFIRYKHAKTVEQVKNNLTFDANVYIEQNSDSDVRKELFMNDDKFFENGTPKNNLIQKQSAYRTRTYIFTIKNKDIELPWAYLCALEEDYDYLCMNVIRKTINGYIRFKSPKSLYYVNKLLQFDSETYPEYRNDVDVRKSLLCHDDSKFFEKGIPKNNAYHYNLQQPIIQKVVIDEETTELIANTIQEKNKMVLEEIKQQTKIVNDTKHYIMCNTPVDINKTFNLNNYLNVICKDAINFDIFVCSFTPCTDNISLFNNNGYVDATSKIFINGYNNLELSARPVYCTDMKRKTIYVKVNNQWIIDKTLHYIHNVIHHIVTSTFIAVKQTIDNNSVEYINIIISMLAGVTPEDIQKNINKIVNIILPHIQVTK
jgi:hypothetical protein